MRERRYLTFDMNDPRHRQALSLLSARSSKQRSEYVISCILKAEQEIELKETVRAAVLEALRGVSPVERAELEKTAIESIGELPGELLPCWTKYEPSRCICAATAREYAP